MLLLSHLETTTAKGEMEKKWENTLQSITRKQIDFVLSIFDKRTISENMRYALFWRHESGRSLHSVSIMFKVDRASLSKAEDKVVGTFSAMNEFFNGG